MGSCYVCGAYVAPNEGYRRRVNTGNSYGLNFGKRVSSSTRTYYGDRTLCAYCAENHDKWEKIKGAFTLAVIVVVALLYFIGSQADRDTISSSISTPPTVERTPVSADQKAEARRPLETKAADETLIIMIVTAPEELNVRTGPGTSFEVVGKIRARDIVAVQRTENGWSYIGSGWVRSKFLEKTNN
jgi:hypothetical protein